MKNERKLQTVEVADLQTDLIACLERVRAGEELLVSDHHRPIAILIPLEIEDEIEEEELEMAAASLVRLPTEELRILSGGWKRQ